MKGITWSRDSHGLFDYESRSLTKRTMKTHYPSQIVRKHNDLDLIALQQSNDYNMDPDIKPLLNIINEDGKYFNTK